MKAREGSSAGVNGASEGAAPDIGTLQAYTNLKQDIASQLRAVRAAFHEAGNERRADECQDLMGKLAEDRFTLAVLGQFKRGKSSLMNAIIGREVLPTGVLPLTSAITILKFGPAERLVIHREGSVFPQEVPVSQLAEYVTERGNPGNEKRVKTASLELPLPFLRRGLEFVDTPGIGSVIEANTATTYEFLPQCDAVLFVTSVDTPLTAVEVDFLRQIRGFVRKLFFVLNKIDLLGEDECRDVLGFVRDTIRTQTAAVEVRVFPLSCRLGLAAKSAADASAYEASGLKALEEALAQFLAEERASTFLVAVADKALRLLDEGITAQPPAARPRQEPPPTEPGRPPLSPTDIRARLLALREAAPLGFSPSAAEGQAEPVAAPESARPAPPVASSETLGDGTIAQGLRLRGCPVCQHMALQVFQFLAAWQHDLVREEKAQSDFAAELGFCPFHTWQLINLSSPFSASVGYAKLVERISRELSRLSAQPVAGQSVRALVPAPRDCRICRLAREAEDTYIQGLSAFIREPCGRQVYAGSHGLCLRHLGLLVAVSDSEAAPFLLDGAARRFADLAEDMQSFALKHEGIRRHLQHEDERDAYLRAIIHIVGERSVDLAREADGGI